MMITEMLVIEDNETNPFTIWELRKLQFDFIGFLIQLINEK